MSHGGVGRLGGLLGSAVLLGLGCGRDPIPDSAGAGTGSTEADGSTGDSSSSGSTGSTDASESDGSSSASTTYTPDTGTTAPPCDPIQLADIAQGDGGFILDGLTSLYGGMWASGAGDVNGDGLDDVVAGSPIYDSPGGHVSNRTFVVFGKADTTEISLDDVAQGIGGFALDGQISNHDAAHFVSGPGDVNGDGLDDVVVGVPTAATPGCNYAGRTYVVFGKADTDRVSLEDVVGGIGGFALDGEAEGDSSGFPASGAGDINGDGLADVIVGVGFASGTSGPFSGRAYVVLGKVGTDSGSLADIAQGIGGFAIDGEAEEDRAGSWVSGIGDINGDGLDDVVLSAPEADPNGLYNAGRAYVVFGKTGTDNVSLVDVAQGVGGFTVDGETEGGQYGTFFLLSGAGDVNDDGIPDVVIGVPRFDANGVDAGRTYVVHGKADTQAVSLVDIKLGIGGFAIDGEAAFDESGYPVSGAGDLNGDGLADVVVGAIDASPNGVHAGRTYVVFGKENGERVELSEVARGRGGFALDGEAEEHTSWGHGTGGDVSGDGVPDLVVTARTGYGEHRIYVVFGGDLCAGE